ncbi:four helix bundle protein [Anabaena cylindrica FACHB-243]|nr:four helix bundle protein [Anabaena cylindrica FACHB-243]BAY03025.1 S23 ribosomal protein [Anabaena cylindrica PCC 7122]
MEKEAIKNHQDLRVYQMAFEAAMKIFELSKKFPVEERYSLRELHKKDDPILWDGHLARPCIISGQDARTTRNFGIFF